MTDYLEAQLHAAQEKVANTEREMLALKQADRVALRHPDATARRPDNPSANQAVARTVRDGRQTENSSLVGITDSASVQTELKVYVLSMEDELRKLRVQYTDNYPGVIELREKIARYTEALNDVPRRELELGRLKRDLDVAQDSLLFIRKNLERSRIVAAGNTDKINVISIVDPPRTNDDPISPNRLLIMVASVVFGFGFAVVLALVRNNLDHTLRSARDIQRELGLKSLGSLAKFEGQQP
jgi:tyrosine-protein kinase Etk/Wzc